MKKGTILCGILCFILGAAVCGGGAAYAVGVMAERSTNSFYVDGEQVELPAYLIGGNNYVMLRDVGQAVGFNVYWNEESRTVQIESDKPYTGVAPDVDELDENMAIRLEIVRLANEERKKVGAPALAVNDALMDAAQDCAGKGFTKHDAKYECLTTLSYGYPHGFSANLTVFNGTDATYISTHAISNWVNSKGHYATMIDPSCEDIGVGVVIENGRVYCYMLVGDTSAYNPYGE